MIEFICAWVASGLILKAVSDYFLAFGRESWHYVMAAIIGPFIIVPILQIDVPAYFEDKEAERKIREEFKRRANGQH